MPFLFLLITLSIRFISPETYRSLVSEDGILETLQFIFYLLTGLLIFSRFLALRTQPKKWFLRLCLLFMSGLLLFISFEEISWGQRLLNYNHAEFFTVYNVQQEVTVHNLMYIQPIVHWIFIFLGIGLGLVIPLMSRLKVTKDYHRHLFGWNLSTYFLPLAVVYILLFISEPTSLNDPNAFGLIWRDQEVVETLLSLGMLVYNLRS